MKKLRHNHRRVITTAIAVLMCCTGTANATVEQKKGTNAIAFTEQRGDKTANLVLSTLDLAIMDPVERDNMLASLKTQYGKPKVWASRAARSTSRSVFGFARGGEKEKYGVRLRARQVVPIFNPLLSQVAPAVKVPSAIGEMSSADLLGVERSETLTWSANQDDYLGIGESAGPTNFLFFYSHSNKWINTGFNYKFDFGNTLSSPAWNGWQMKVKPNFDCAGRFAYNQYWYEVIPPFDTFFTTRNVTGNASLGVRLNIQAILAWGYDWNLAWAGHWGLGAEVSIAVGMWSSVDVDMNSTNTSDAPDILTTGGTWSPYVEAVGSAWIGKLEHKNAQTYLARFHPPEDVHKMAAGLKVQIVFQGKVGLKAKWQAVDYDWCKDQHNNDMGHYMYIGEGFAQGKALARADVSWGRVSFQAGYLIWEGSVGDNTNKAMVRSISTTRIETLDYLL